MDAYLYTSGSNTLGHTLIIIAKVILYGLRNIDLAGMK